MFPCSAVVLNFNEEKRLGRCIASLGNFRNVILLDSFSTDRSVELAVATWQEIGRDPEDLRVYAMPWPGFTKARNLTCALATEPWVFWIDADEWMDERLKSDLNKFFLSRREDARGAGGDQVSGAESDQVSGAGGDQVSGAEVERRSLYLGHWVRFGGWTPDRKKRLGARGRVRWSNGPKGADVHEDLVADAGRFIRLKGPLLHEPFLSKSEHLATNERYSRLLADAEIKVRRESGRSAPSIFFIYARFFWKFLENYFLKFGVLDGLTGLWIAWASALSLKLRLSLVRQGMRQGADQA